MKPFKLLLLCILLYSCAAEEKPHYFLNNTSLRLYEGGDSLSYSVLEVSNNGDHTGTYRLSLLNRDEFAPPNNSKIELFFEEQTKIGNISIPFLPQFYSQNAQGDLFLEAISNSGDILWLLDSNETVTGNLFYPNEITTLSTTLSFTKKLQRCDENNDCVDAGQYKLTNLALERSETISTSYAKFEAYLINIDAELLIFDADQAGSSQSYSFSGSQWFYPPLGVVKFVYDVNNFKGNTTLIGSLNNTNISIDDLLKANN